MAIEWLSTAGNRQLKLLDQRKLPHSQQYVVCNNAQDVANAIQDMVVRGAPAIGICAAYGIVLQAHQQKDTQAPALMQDAFETLSQSRPTAVNLFWAIEKMQQCYSHYQHGERSQLLEQLEQCALLIHNQDIRNNELMGEIGADVMHSHETIGILTHCNAGALATGGYGTALGVIRSLHKRQHLKHVFASETRPWLQGARLTAWELMQDGIDVCLTTEGAIGQLMASGKIQWVVVGADRIAANGDVANKIGTYNLAILARYHGVKFMVVAPTSTFDISLNSGAEIPIEQRSEEEVTKFNKQPIAPDGCTAINPSFDVTPNSLIDVIVCEHGALFSPFSHSIMQSLQPSKVMPL
ncbi:S-methyl-5-thioribose-1-phosphate isomerase [Bermanella sp. R86510]|uniref:S-methyl-5-thioribose-1-phosphate isomerase n=1 Tax=unclassified Bermanella TaxID=2627862 RepID=UPI0037CB7648